jgi:hypothetical protein
MKAELENFNGAIADQYEALMAYAALETDLDNAGQLLLAAAEIKSSAAFLYEEMAARFSKIMGDRPEVVVNGRLIEKKTGSSRSGWQHKELIDTIANRIQQLATNLDTGEVNLTPREAIDKLLKFAHIDYYRVKELKTIDINADLYSTSDESKAKTSIIVRKG